MAAVEETERLRARLAAEEKEALEAIKGDLCRWLAKQDVLALDIVPATFLEKLDSGVQLCSLATLLQDVARRSEKDGKKLPARVPMEPLVCNAIKASRDSAVFRAKARDNAAQFIRWCRGLGVAESVVFESVGLVEHSDERRVILCLLDVARVAEKVGITPPQLVTLEREIAQLESRESGQETGSETVQVAPEGVEEEEEEAKESSFIGSIVEEVPVIEDEGKGGEGEEPSAKRIKTTKHGQPCPPSQQSPSPCKPGPRKQRRSSTASKGQKSSKKDTVDKKVMQSVRECTCEHALAVEKYGNGKFAVSHTLSSPGAGKTTIYARLLSDRVMVRVGGGWETLEHFLLKHDPCRVNHITREEKTLTAKSTRKRQREH